MTPKISIVIPFYFGMKNWQFFLTRCLESIERQTFKDYEVILVKHSTMPVTSNRSMECAKAEIVKVLYMDDWLESENYLEELFKAFENGAEWVITAASNNKIPYWTEDIGAGNNKLGSPSALAYRNYIRHSLGNFFDEKLSWMLDVDLYKRLERLFGKPGILESVVVGIGIGDHQMTNTLTDAQKQEEFNYLQEKYG